MISWWVLLIFLTAIAVVAGIAIRYSRKKPTFRGVPAALITRVIAGIHLLVAGIGTVTVVLRTLFNSTVSVSLPVREFWPSLPSAVKLDGVYAQVVGGGFSSAEVEVNGLDGVARIWLAAGALVQGLTTVMVAVVVMMICTSIIRQDPFRAVLIRGISFTGIGIIIGGIVWQICAIVGGGMASVQTLGATGWEINTEMVHWEDIHQVIGLPRAVTQEWNIEFWPLGIGLSLLAIAAVFRFGQGLKNDTDGLV